MTEQETPSLYLDEDVPHQLGNTLQERGVQARLAKDEMQPGTADVVHMKACADNSWLLVTLNRSDFQRLHWHWTVLRTWDVLPRDHGGILSATGHPTGDEWAQPIIDLLSDQGRNLRGSMWVWDIGTREWAPQ